MLADEYGAVTGEGTGERSLPALIEVLQSVESVSDWQVLFQAPEVDMDWRSHST
jgi:hypothetical protein